MFYADNQPDYYTTMGPPLKEVHFDVIASGEVERVDDFYEPTSQTIFVRIRELNGNLTADDVRRILSKAYSKRCYCEHDCCGHRFGSASVTLHAMDTAEINIQTARNY